ncbi:phosphatidylinositol 4-phosphate 5-kinase-like protein 1 [Poecilia formosa]|uniref:phosphatidylinositol 4-phosphate 5-kinase-like protein 1 n=1 Tax=Poecilia formosa TaxID=48698 RepID=UPI000443E216|nr:PREDICTED: phosphatidylinositol 4-phosphate 5-kinase-like protein 1 [Poecilia formosa]
MEPSGRLPPPSQRSATVKRRRWGGLRQQWKLLGLFEIDQQHDFYGLTCRMKEGLAAAIHTSTHTPPANDLSDDDFRSKVTQVHKDFSLETFGGPVFAALRASLGITEDEYLQSLCSESCYLQFISNSKSKADFFLTNDKRFFLKTQNKREIKFLLSNLKIYVEHLRKFPHSLLVKFLALPLHHDERNQNRSFATLIVRTKKSVNPGSSPIHAGVPGAVLDDDAGPSPEPDSGLTSSQDRDDSTRTSPRPAGTGADSPDIPDFRAQNRRLLPNLKNPLHVIDGPEQRYFIGIIDVFTVYGLKKRLEHLWKSLRHHGRSFSTVSPQEYSGRLRGWVRDHSE